MARLQATNAKLDKLIQYLGDDCHVTEERLLQLAKEGFGEFYLLAELLLGKMEGRAVENRAEQIMKQRSSLYPPERRRIRAQVLWEALQEKRK